jgi:uncharacterized protein (TIGR00297 family)
MPLRHFHLLMPDTLARALPGLVAAGAVALAAWRAGSLSGSGAAAAMAVGTAAVSAGWAWGVLLVLYFVLSSALSRAGGAEKERRIGGVVAKGGARDAVQVLANGGVFALCALAVPLAGSHVGEVAAAAAGALAAAAADTWATEVGVLFGGAPRALRTLRPVPAGTSGAVSAAGMAAMVCGALSVALAARALGLVDAVIAVTVAGCAGAVADTILGATMQERRWCDRCGLATERPMHDCGAPTRRAGGLARVDNDVVNLAATAVGAVVALLLAFGS